MHKLLKLLTVCAASPLIAACAGSLTPMSSTDGALAAFKPIPNSRHAPCVMQRAVAAHNSAYDTLKTGTEKVYKAPAKQCRTPDKKTS